MKGIVFTLLGQVVSDEHGEDVWDDLIEAAGVDGAYTAVGTYDHSELHALVDAAASTLDSTADEVQVWFGRRAMPLLAKRYPEVFEGHTSTRPFVLTLNDVIHPQVRKLFPGAYAPSFEFDTSIPDRVVDVSVVPRPMPLRGGSRARGGRPLRGDRPGRPHSLRP